MEKNVQRNEAYEYVNFIDVAYECLSLLNDDRAASHVVHLASSMYNACRSLFPDSLAPMFYDLIELAEYASDTSTLEYVPKAKQALKATLKGLTDESVINPSVTAEEQAVLNENSLPILKRMTEVPKDSPALFIDLVHVLDTLVSKETLSAWAAAKEVSYATDRPQIMESEALRPALENARNLELPGEFRHAKPIDVWQTFVRSLPPTEK